VSLTVVIVVAVSPTTQTLNVTQSQQFMATVTGSTNQAVSWSVNDVAGGNATVGSISAMGLYTAPAIPPIPNTVTVKAASVEDPSRTGSAAVTVVNPAPTLSVISPTTLDGGSPDTTLTVAGTNFTPQSTVQLSGASLVTTFVSATQLTAVIPAAQLASAGILPVTVLSPSPGGGTSNAVSLTVVIVVAVSPTTQTLNVTQTQQFMATVTGSSNQAVAWSVNDIAGGNATVGTVTANGLYTAPGVPPSPSNTVTVKASSVATPSGTGSASVTVVNPLPAITSIAPSSVNAGGSDTTLTVNGTGFCQQSTVYLSGSPLSTVFSGSSTQLSAVIPAALLTTPGTAPVTVVTPAPGGGTSNTVNLTIVAGVRVTPAAPTLVLNETRQFTATVSGESDQTVTWFVNGLPGGDSTIGTISATGLYIAPGVVPSPATVTIKAVSVANPTKSGTASATLTLPPSDNYPRPDAGSILRTPPPLLQVPQTGTKVAILDWTSKDPAGTDEDVLSLCNSLSPLGIPHVHPTSLADASGYPLIAVAGDFEGNLTTSERNALISYVQNGGILFLWNLTDPSLLASLGIGTASGHLGTTVRPLTFEVETGDPALRYIDDDAEINLQMAYPSYGHTFGYGLGSAQVLASWDNGEAAMLRSDLGTGRAYVFGWRLRRVVTDAELLSVPGAEPPWTNVPVLDADIQKMLLRGVYEDAAGANAQIRQFAPDGKHAALILTHDIDDITSYERTPVFAQLEHGLGVKATFNFTTSPYDTGWVEAFYDASGRQEIQQALDLENDIEAHSIGHFPDFDLAPFGSGSESAANYFPQYSYDLNQTLGMSVLGELGVSRWLLENDFPITVEGFRSGYLDVPDRFLEGLKETGYRRDSTYAAGVTRGSYPFVAFSVVSGAVTTYPIVEYPLAISDDHKPPDDFKPDTYSQYLDAWESVIRANYANNAPTVLLIHPVDDTLRVQALQDILQRVSDLDLWVGDWKTFADFWEAQGTTCQRYP
jgi:hypothetical protein